MSAAVAEAPEVVRAVVYHFPALVADLRRLLPEPTVERTWRRTPNGARVTLTVECPPAKGRVVAETLVDRLRLLGFYADAEDYSPARVRVSGYYGARF